jgi:peroxiredoxin-like protein
MDTSHQYRVDVEWAADRKGELHSPDLTQTISVATPPQFPKGMPDIWSPEHLFTAAVNSCLMTTFLSIAENSRLEFISFRSKGTGKLEMVDGKYMMSEVVLEPIVEISHEKDLERAQRVLQKSESACLISNSVKSKITFLPTVKVKEPAGAI